MLMNMITEKYAQRGWGEVDAAGASGSQFLLTSNEFVIESKFLFHVLVKTISNFFWLTGCQKDISSECRCNIYIRFCLSLYDGGGQVK